MTVRRSLAPSSSHSTPALLPVLIVRGLDPADDIPEALPLLRAVIRECHRFLIDHLSSEGNSFPHNPTLLPNAGPAGLLSPAPAPITQLLGIDAKNIIVCASCHAVREK